MSTKEHRRRSFSPEGKAAILRRHLADKVSVAALAEEYHIQPSVLFQWQRQLLANAARALESRRAPDRREAKLEAKIEALETKLQRKDSVIAEISEEFVQTRKSLGISDDARGGRQRVFGARRRSLGRRNEQPVLSRAHGPSDPVYASFSRCKWRHFSRHPSDTFQ